MVTVNVVVLAGTVAADPVECRMPSGDEVPGISSRWHDDTHKDGGRDLRRLSEVRPGEKAVSLDTQEADCRRLAKGKGWRVAGIYKDRGRSA